MCARVRQRKVQIPKLIFGPGAASNRNPDLCMISHKKPLGEGLFAVFQVISLESPGTFRLRGSVLWSDNKKSGTVLFAV